MIQLSFQYIEKDYRTALRAHYADRLRLRLDFLTIALSLVCGLYLLRSSRFHSLGLVFLGLAALLALLLAALFFIVPSWIFRTEPKFREGYSLSFSEEGIHFRTANIDSRLQWEMYSRVLVTRDSYLLYYGSRQLTVIPSRVFEGEPQRLDFERLLARHIPRIDKK